MAALLAATTFLWVGPGDAQTRYREPAEFPPASFTGSQYVDSRGCIFVRAGIAGTTTWVPRVTTSRQNLCGARPTFADGTSAQNTVTAQGAIPPGATLITAPPATAAAPATTRPAAVPAAPAPRPQATARVNARVAPMPPAVIERPGAPMQTIASITTMPAIRPTAQAATRPAPVKAAAANGCPAGVRCGPQAQDPVPRGAGAAVRTGRVGQQPAMVVNRRDLPSLAPQTRIVPRHVAEAQAQAATATVVPPGYRPVWTDDRLNPRRAHGTVAGQMAMDLIWTQTVPRRLIDRKTGRDMTAYNPNLQYPYTDLTTQVRAGVPVKAGATLSTTGTATPKARQADVAHVSTRATPQATAAPQPKRIAGRFVQVGAFADPNNADTAIRRLQAAGLPVSVQRSSSKGKPVQVILAGPFGNPGALSQGLGVARAAGFRDAFPRN